MVHSHGAIHSARNGSLSHAQWYTVHTWPHCRGYHVGSWVFAAGNKPQYRAYSKPKKSPDRCFQISHYAGDVVYTIEGFVEKNRDALSQDISALLEDVTKWETLKQLALLPRQRVLGPEDRHAGHGGVSARRAPKKNRLHFETDAAFLPPVFSTVRTETKRCACGAGQNLFACLRFSALSEF